MDNIDNIANAQILFSAVFVFIGVMVFYVSSLISGHNIYKDLEFQHSFMLSCVVGSVLFLMLPTGFMIFIPELFDSALKDDLHNRSKVVISIYNTLFKHALWPFVWAATGLGVVVGCITLLRVRWEILVELRKKAGLSFFILSYSSAWDNFLMRAKKHALIAVELGGGIWIKGHLKNFSIKKEQKQLVLEGYKMTSENNSSYAIQKWLEGSGIDCMESLCAGQMLITEADEIKKIVIHSNGLKKHSHALSHSAQAFYCVLLAFGFLLLCISFHLTYDYIILVKDTVGKPDFPFLGNFYRYGFWVFVAFSLFCLASGSVLLKMDYSSFRVAMILNRAISFLLSFFLFVIFLIATHFLNENVLNSIRNCLVAVTGALLFLVHYYYLSFKPGCKIKKAFKKFYSQNDIPTGKIKRPLSDILIRLCDEMDLNTPDTMQT